MGNTKFSPGLAGVFVLALFAFIGVSRYLTFNPEVFFGEQREVYKSHQFWLYLHILGGIVAIATGPFQFVKTIRQKRLGLHRVMGRVYLTGCLSGAIGGLYMATMAYGGFASTMGLGSLAIMWLITGTMALVRIKQRNVKAHREWMIRSFALTLAAAMLRIYLIAHGILEGTGATEVPFIEAYTAITWLCWVPNLFVAEWIINTSGDHKPIPS
jgi:uncharacterized membrane protein